MYKYIKRILDALVAITVLIAISPLFIILVLLLFIANNGYPFYFQKRPGKNEKVFTICKFKSMNDKKDANGKLLPDADRITKVGAFVRKTSLDELPQLLNVVKGDMSFVGPRPLMVSYLELYNEQQKRRHIVRPGVTGWAQVNGRNAISWEQKFKFDVWYVENQSFLLDFKILLLTVKKVFKTEGISAADNATMPRFEGTK